MTERGGLESRAGTTVQPPCSPRKYESDRFTSSVDQAKRDEGSDALCNRQCSAPPTARPEEVVRKGKVGSEDDPDIEHGARAVEPLRLVAVVPVVRRRCE